ncbi:Clavaminate synthase-like protein [Trametopsis cervina]|nr:Clavaminate synthase-like protein [Trametopsis cervina]
MLFSSSPRSSNVGTARASQLISALDEGSERIVDVELGRYDDTQPDGFHQVPMRLAQYLEWLRSDRPDGRISGKQVYLAQWSGHGEASPSCSAVREIAVPPPILSTLITDGHVDMYQSALFLGPTGAVTPLHYDPYINLFHLQASSAPDEYAKHVFLLPPTASPYVNGTGARKRQKNTATVDFRIHLGPSHVIPHLQVAMEASQALVSDAVDAIESSAVTCVLREGETLYIPRGWWHRVENIAMHGGSGKQAGWTAGVSWWFLPRRQ